jgi:hypothetical protein
VVAVRCLPGVGRITLLEALNRIRERQRDVRIGDAGAFRFSRDYLIWVTDASRLLSGLISSLDVDTLASIRGWVISSGRRRVSVR